MVVWDKMCIDNSFKMGVHLKGDVVRGGLVLRREKFNEGEEKGLGKCEVLQGIQREGIQSPGA